MEPTVGTLEGAYDRLYRKTKIFQKEHQKLDPLEVAFSLGFGGLCMQIEKSHHTLDKSKSIWEEDGALFHSAHVNSSSCICCSLGFFSQLGF